MATSLQSYTKSTLPSLLDRYQPLNSRRQVSKRQRLKSRENKRREAFHDMTFVEDGDDSKKSLIEERHLETYRNMYRLRNAMYARYMDLLNKKVEKQRSQLQVCGLQCKTPLKQQGEAKVVTELPHVKLSHDLKYMDSVPKSTNYLIFGLQNELTKSGILKTREDFDKFHNSVLAGSSAGSQLKDTLRDVKSQMTAGKTPSFQCSRNSKRQSAKESSINKGQGELSNGSLADWQHPRPRAHHLGKHRQTPAEAEKPFPKLLFSRHSEPQSVQEPPCTVVQQQQQIMEERRRDGRNLRHEMYFRQLRQMYYVSLSNMASTQRLLEKNSLFAEFEDSQSVHDLVVYLFPNEHKEAEIKTTDQGIAGETQHAQRKAAICPRSKRRISEETKDARYISKETKDTLEHVEPVDERPLTDLKKSSKDKECVCGTPTDSAPAPLTMETVVMENTIMEAKGVSSNWTNYVKKATESCFVPRQSGERGQQDAST